MILCSQSCVRIASTTCCLSPSPKSAAVLARMAAPSSCRAERTRVSSRAATPRFQQRARATCSSGGAAPHRHQCIAPSMQQPGSPQAENKRPPSSDPTPGRRRPQRSPAPMPRPAKSCPSASKHIHGTKDAKRDRVPHGLPLPGLATAHLLCAACGTKLLHRDRLRAIGKQNLGHLLRHPTWHVQQAALEAAHLPAGRTRAG